MVRIEYWSNFTTVFSALFPVKVGRVRPTL